MTKKTVYDYILFDADGTLYDYEKAEAYALEATFLEYNLPYHKELLEIYKKINSGYWNAFELGQIDLKTLRIARFETFFKKEGITTEAEAFGKSYIKHLSESTFLMPGALEILESLSKHTVLAIITNGISEVQRRRFQLSKVLHYFRGIIISEEIGFSKPHKAYFDYACKTLGIEDRSKALVVGDSLSSDILGGNNFGIDTCWYNPKGVRADEAIKPVFTIKELKELEDIVFNGQNPCPGK